MASSLPPRCMEFMNKAWTSKFHVPEDPHERVQESSVGIRHLILREIDAMSFYDKEGHTRGRTVELMKFYAVWMYHLMMEEIGVAFNVAMTSLSKRTQY